MYRGIILVFDPRRCYKIPMGIPLVMGALSIHGGVKNLQFSTEISVYLGHGMR